MNTSSNGAFDGRVVVEWLNDAGNPDRRMRLIEPITYIDPNNKRWPVPALSVVDGASIPKAFWSLIGPPFIGDYRRASVVHDHYCVVRTEPWQAVHRMFYNASLAGGVSKLKAKTMYAAVYAGGPRWKVSAGEFGLESLQTLDIPAPEISSSEIERIAHEIEETDISLDEIDQQLDTLAGK